LSGLPRPFITLRRSLEGEKSFVLESHFKPFIENPMTPLTAEQLQQMMDRLVQLAGPASADQNPALQRLGIMGLGLKTYPEDKKMLVARGFDAQAVERLPVLQVGFLASIHRYQAIMDDMIKWSNEPYYVSAPELAKLEKQLGELKASYGEGIPMASLLIPAINKVNLATTRLDRRIAALRCIEAIRLHAAANGGQLPTSLDEIKEAPIPHDPLTGKPFEYQVEGAKATLKGVSPMGPNSNIYAIYYELSLTR
jgi:hypothetical protein